MEKVLVMFSLDGTDFPISQEKKPLLEVRMVRGSALLPIRNANKSSLWFMYAFEI